MTELSPAPRAIVRAFVERYEQCGPYDENWPKLCLAAALQAAADQVVPKGPRPSADSAYHLMSWSKSLDQYAQRKQTRAELLAIADELKEAS
jgi:hypothetical protein